MLSLKNSFKINILLRRFRFYRKKLFACIIAVQLLLSILNIPVFASDTLTWKINGSVLTISGQGDMEDYGGPSPYHKTAPWYNYRSVITKIVIEKGVKSIGYAAFKDCSEVSHVVIDDSVVKIGSDAFYGCKKLSSIDIPNSVTNLGGGAFKNCISLTEISIPNSVTEIKNSTFWNCTNLTNVTIEEDSKIQYIRDYAFKGCASLKHIDIPESLQTIGTSAFESCNSLESISLPNSIETISDKSFYNCSKLSNVNIPDTILNIGKDAFYGTAIFNNKSNWENGALYISNCLIIGYKEDIRSGTSCIAAFAFSRFVQGFAPAEINLPNSIKSISYRAFYDYSDF